MSTDNAVGIRDINNSLTMDRHAVGGHIMTAQMHDIAVMIDCLKLNLAPRQLNGPLDHLLMRMIWRHQVQALNGSTGDAIKVESRCVVD